MNRSAMDEEVVAQDFAEPQLQANVTGFQWITFS
jgi:hypothetical protein